MSLSENIKNIFKKHMGKYWKMGLMHEELRVFGILPADVIFNPNVLIS